MTRIQAAQPMDGYKLKIDFDNGSSMILDMSHRVKTTRFRPLMEPGLFKRVLAEPYRLYWNEWVEMSVGELFDTAQKDKPERELK